VIDPAGPGDGLDIPSDPTGHVSFGIERPAHCRGCAILLPSGYIDSTNVECLRRAVGSIVNAGFRHLIISFSGIPTTRSDSVWGCLVDLRKFFQERGGDLVLTGVAPGVRQVWTLLGLDSLIAHRNSVEEALALLSGRC